LASRGQLRPSINVAIDTPAPDVVRAERGGAGRPVTQVRKLCFEGAGAISEADLRTELQDRVDLESACVDPAPLVDAVKLLYAERGRPATRVAADPLVFDGDAAELADSREGSARAPASRRSSFPGIAEERAGAARASLESRRVSPCWDRPKPTPGGASSVSTSTAASEIGEGRVRAGPPMRRAGSTMGFAVVEGLMSVVTGVTFEGLQATNGAFAARRPSP